MVSLYVAAGVFVLAALAELLHARRTARLAGLAFGPSRRPAVWTLAAPVLRALGLAAAAWGMLTLLFLPPKSHRLQQVSESEFQYLILLLDVSPSMKLADAGSDKKRRRDQRAADVLESFFQRAPMERYKTTVIAFYTGAKPVLEKTTDLDIVRNVLTELPLSQAFEPGATDLFAGLKEAARMAKGLPPGSATLMIVSDGDSVPAAGMPKLPDAIGHVVVVGIGDPVAGSFIDGHQSRQDAMTLRTVAARLKGSYHNGNELHLSTDLLARVTQPPETSAFRRLTLREYALLALALGCTILACLPWLLSRFGTTYRPGVRAA